MLNVKKTLTKILSSLCCKTLYDSTKVSSGTITLADAYTNYDFLVVSYFVNLDRFTKVFDCDVITANPNHNFVGDFVSYGDNFSFQSNCYFKPTDSTHLTVANTGNNVNFTAGIVKIVGMKIPFIGGGTP